MTHQPFTDDDQLAGFEKMPITQADDYEGAVVATVVRLKNAKRHSTAILHVHGFNDYFFHDHIARALSAQNIDFYGVDLRKSGRSLLDHQKMNNLRDIEEYFEDIASSLQFMQQFHRGPIVLGGHSMGGLIVALFAACGRYDHLFHGVFLNSPFFEQNKDFLTRKLLVPLVSRIGKKHPNLSVPGGFSKFYGPSLHQSEHGLWDYNLKWKPHVAPLVNAGWVRAIHQAQKKLQSGIEIKQSVLLIFPKKSYRNFRWNDRFLSSDAVVNVAHIRQYAGSIRAQMQTYAIDGAVHDVFLSDEKARNQALSILIHWISASF